MSKLAREVADRLRESGLRLTPQRFTLMKHLVERDCHASADELFAGVNQKNTKMSRASVYNNLHALAEAGLVRQLPVEGAVARYDANLHRHHHFICDGCGAVEDIAWFEPPDAGLKKHKITSFEAVLRGLCPKCK